MEPVVPVHVSLWSDDAPHLEGQILDLDEERTRAAFPVVRKAHWYAIGRQVSLQLAVEGASRKATTRAWVQGWYLDGDQQVYELRFCEEAQVQLEVLPLLSSALNRRQAYRAKPTLEPVPASVRGRRVGRGFDVQVLDFSVRGASIAMENEELDGSDGMHLYLSLDFQGEGPIEIACRVIHRQLLGSQVCYGLEFDVGATENFDTKAEVLQHQVSAIQAAQLRRRAV